MSWGAVATVVGGALSRRSAKKSAGQAADASMQAADVQAQAQREALDYLKQREALPQQFREGALTGLNNIYGIGPEGNQQTLIDRAMASPLYQGIMGTKKSALDDITARSQATGHGRSGGHVAALGRESQRINESALLTSYMDQLSGLKGLAGLPDNSNTIAQQMSDIGGTRAAGITAAGQARQDGTQNAINTGLGFANLGVQSGAFEGLGGRISGLFSDIRLKTNIQPAGMRDHLNWYTWDWNDDAAELGLYGQSEGVLAHEIVDIQPEAIGLRDGYLTVRYDVLAQGVQ